MARPRKKIRNDDLRKAYVNLRMSTVEISKNSKHILGVHVTPATVYNYLVRLGIPIRNKSEGVSISRNKKAFIKLTDIAGRNPNRGTRWNTRYWNARWLVAIGKVKATKSKLTHDQASILSKLLDEYGDTNILPEDLVNNTFEEARREGFPYIILDDEKKEKTWKQLVAACPRKTKNSYQWIGLGTTLATMFHPHIYECKKNGKMSPVELFNSDEDLKRAIRKGYCLYGKMNNRILNDICRNEDAAGRVGNFPPRVGKAIISEIWGMHKGLTVLDPCAGFGGRLFSCACSGMVKKYVGIDLSKATCDGLIMSAKFLKSVGCNMEVEIINANCITEIEKIKEQFDMVMTSPPFFNVEEYVGVSLPDNYKTWILEFIEPMIRKSVDKLKNGSKMVFYVENVGSYPLPEDCSKIAISYGLIKVPSINFTMNYGASRRKERGKGINILVWGKSQ